MMAWAWSQPEPGQCLRENPGGEQASATNEGVTIVGADMDILASLWTACVAATRMLQGHKC